LKIKRFLTILTFIFCLFIATQGQPVNAQTSVAQLGVFDSAQVAPGETIQLLIQVKNVQDLYGVDFTLSFDPAIVQVKDMDTSQAGIQASLGGFLDPGLLLYNLADNADGFYRFAMTQVNPSIPKSGDGTIVVITFIGIKEGETDLVIQNAELASSTAEKILVEGVKAKLMVIKGAPTQAATMGITQATGLIILNTYTPTPTPAATLEATAFSLPTATILPIGNDETDADAVASGILAPTGSEYWLVEHWWIILVLGLLVIGAAVYFYIIKK